MSFFWPYVTTWKLPSDYLWEALYIFMVFTVTFEVERILWQPYSYLCLQKFNPLSDGLSQT